MKKKFLSVMLASVMAMSMIGCGSSAVPETEPAQEAEQEATGKTSYVGSYDEILPDWELPAAAEENPAQPDHDLPAGDEEGEGRAPEARRSGK